MRLAFCLYKYFPHSGLARDMLRIAREAHRRGHHVALYARQWHGDAPPEFPVTIVDGGGLSNHGQAARFARSLHLRLAETEQDAVVAFNKIPGADFYFAGDGCFVARVRRRYPRLYELTPRYRTSRRLEEGVFGPASRTRIMLLSDRERLEYQAYYATPEERMRLLPPILHRIHQSPPLTAERRTAVRAGLGVGEDETLLLLVGSGFPTKGVDRAIRALAALPAPERPRSRLVVVGRGKARRYRALAAQLGVGDRVVFLGGRDDVPELLRAADLLLHPARHESAGAVLLEALAAGLPVITTAACGYAAHVRDARAGIVLDTPFDQGALNRALAWLATAPDRRRLEENARRYGRNEALYRMPETAVDLIESWQEDAPALSFPGYVHPELADLSRARPALSDWLAIEGEVFRRTGDRKTLRFEHQGREYFMKAHYGVGWKEIIKNLLQLKWPVLDAGNEWLAIHCLKLLGVPTMTPVAFGRGAGLARRQSFIVTRALRGMVSLESYAAGAAARKGLRPRLVDKVAKIARSLHDNGINHRDFYLCHFLLDPNFDRPADVALHVIDLHRAQVRHRTPRRWRIKDIGGLYYSALDTDLTRRDRLRFIRSYSGLPLRKALADPGFWRRVERRALRLRRAEERRGYADVSGIPGERP